MNNGTPSLEETPDLTEPMINLRRAQETDLQIEERVWEKMGRIFEMLNPSGPSISNPAASSISNPSGSQASNPPDSSVSNSSSSVSNPSRSSVFNQPDSSVSNSSGSLVSYPSGSQASNPPDSSVSNPSASSVFNQPNSSVSNSSGSSVSNPSGSQASNLPDSSVSSSSESLVSNLSSYTVSKPSESSLSNPSGLSTSKKYKNHISRKTSTAGNRPPPSVTTLTGPVRPASSRSRQPLPGHRSKKYKAENTDRTLYNQSVEEDVSEAEEANSAYSGAAKQNVKLKLMDAKARKAVIKTLEDNLRPSVSSSSESSVSNLSSSSMSKSLGSSVSDPPGSFASNPSQSSVSDPSGPSEVDEDVTADEEARSEHEGFNSSDDDEMVPIGSGKTIIHKNLYKKVNWKSYTIATRTLLLAVFKRSVLATHSLTGKKSPAFQDKPAKMCLNQINVADIIWEITSKFKVERSLVRSVITTKCADECKMWKARCKNKRSVPSIT